MARHESRYSLCFIDYNKAFSDVRYDQLIKMLVKKRIDIRYIRIISNLYYAHKASICVEDRTSEEIDVQRGVCLSVYILTSSF